MRLRRLLNVLTQQIRVVVNMAVGLLVTRLVIQHFGAGVYANLGVMLSITGFVATISNAFTGAAARYLTQSISKGEIGEASEYISNTVAAVTGLCGLIGCTIIVIQFARPGTFGDVPIGFIFLFILAVFFNGIAGVFRAINFATEDFASSSFVFIISKLLYGFLTLVFVLYTSLAIWGLAWGFFISGIFALVGSIVLSRAVLPSVKCSFGTCSSRQIREIVTFVVWTLLVYCGLYLSGAGIQIVAKNCIQDDLQLARLVLSFQIGTIAYSFLNSVSIVTSTGIYRALSKQAYADASKLVERYFFLITLCGIVGTTLFAFEGEYLLNIWLGKHLPSNVIPVATGIIVAFAVSSLSVGLHVFLSGANLVNAYGIITFIEGLCSTATIFAWLTLSRWLEFDGLAYVGWLLSLVSGIKLIYTLYRYRHLISLRPPSVYLEKFVQIVLFTGLSLLCYACQKIILPQSLYLVPLRSLLLGIPFVILLLPRSSWIPRANN